MTKDQVEHIYMKMRHKRNFLLRAFFINWLLVLFVWLLWMIPSIQSLTAWLLKGSIDDAHMYMMWLIGAWKIGNVLLFLAPALSAWCGMECCKKEV